MAKNKPHILLTGGGTGGHVFPLLAVAEKLQGRAHLSAIIEKGDQMSAGILAAHGITVHEIKAGKLRRYHGLGLKPLIRRDNLAKNSRDVFRFISGAWTAGWLLRRLKPDAVFVKGGYVGLPVGLAAAVQHIPLILHDSDAIPGLTNRLLKKVAKHIAVGFPREYYSTYPAYKLVHVGIPVREALSHHLPSAKNKRPRLLIVGGSLGARAINQAILTVGKQLMEYVDVVHICGKLDYHALSNVTADWQQSGHYRLIDFASEEYVDLLRESDAVVCRAGATTIAECALAGRPMIIIPNPYLTGGHQLKNAEVLEDASAALIIGEPKLKEEPHALVVAADSLVHDKKQQDWLTKNAKALFPVDAAAKLADLLIKTADHKG